MAIPDYQTIMLPLLQHASDSKIHTLSDATDTLADQFELTLEERKELLPSGAQETFKNRVGWARTYMVKALLLESVKRGSFRITKRGLELLAQKPKKIGVAVLSQYSEFRKFRQKRKPKNKKEEAPERIDTPQEQLENAYQQLRNQLALELMETIKQCSPSFFERLVVDLIVSMGYGGSRKEAGEAIGAAGDGGIDGIIKEDKLGLDTIYIQAKRWQGVVGRPEIQKFAGALQGVKARKGIFITASSFTTGAVEYAKGIETNIILIDGDMLTGLMIDHNVGASSVSVYDVKRLDSDYFTE